MRKSQMVVAVVILVFSSSCRCDLPGMGNPGLLNMMNAMDTDQLQSLKQVMGSPLPTASPGLTNVLPLGSTTPVGFLDIPPNQHATANPAANELASLISSGTLSQRSTEQIAAANNAAAQSQQVADQIMAASKAAQAGRAATPPAMTDCGLSLPSGMVPELPLSILSHLLPSMSDLPSHILAQLPISILSHLSPDVLEKLPPPVLSELPVDALAKLSPSTLSSLPASTITKLPPSVVSHFPADSLDKLPTNFLAGLPLPVLSELPQSLLSRIVQDILGQLPLPLPMLHQLSNLKQLATPEAISNLLGIIDIFRTISGDTEHS